VSVLSSAAPEDDRWNRVVALLEYVESDSVQALSSGDEAELAEQQGFLDEVVKQLVAAGPEGASYLAAARSLEAEMAKQAQSVPLGSGALARRIVAEQKLSRAPAAVPSLAEGETLFAAQCASCHGAQGHGDGPAAAFLQPHPTNFHDPALSALTASRVYDTASYGVPNTEMPAFSALSSAQRWALAFYVMALRQPECPAPSAASVSLQVLATSTDQALSALGPVPCLRRHLPAVSSLTSLAIAEQGLRHALELSRAGARDAARQAVVDAYLEGFEPVEPLLRARDAAQVSSLESGFTRARLAAQDGGDFEGEVKALLGALAYERTHETTGDFWSVFIAAFFILLREGFEAVVVVGALLAVLKKLGATREARVVHLGWVLALIVGALAFLFGQVLFAGANREWLEAVVALGAVGLLLYAATWLNARANISRYMGTLRSKMGDAVARGSTASLFVISFTSAGRESVETAMFLQGLAAESKSGVTWGALAGLVALFGLIALIRVVGFALPMKTLFSASTVLLMATAVMLLGKGLHGLQELGVLPLHPVPFFTLEPLGLFPDAFSLLPQLGLALACLSWNRLSPRLFRTRAPL
jgi:high-affinity iron transporter